MTGSSNAEWLERLPKVELHVHLEGAIPTAALWPLVEKYGGDQEIPTPEALDERFVYTDFPHFIETWHWKNRFLKEYEDFEHIAQAVAEDLVEQNIKYVEAFFSPPDFARYGLEPQPLAEAIRSGLSRVDAVEVALVADLVRDTGPAAAARTLAKVAEVKECGVIGVGIGGSEHDFPPEPFAAVFARARELGFRTSAHAGEAAGPESVRGAIFELRVDRIGHGTRAEEDEALVETLAERRIPVELCPLSNVRTGVVASLADHPVRRYLDRGLLISVNTDDPKMFGNSMAGEYGALQAVHGFSDEEIRQLVRQAVESSWLEEKEKETLLEQIETDPAWEPG